MPGSNKFPLVSAASAVLAALLLTPVPAVPQPPEPAADLSLESAHHVNEGALHFLATPPAKAVHHHQNRFRIDADSLATGWVRLLQCHDNLDAVPRTQITFREGFVRDLKILSYNDIGSAWIEDASVQLVNVRRGARLCLAADIRALRNTGNGYYNLYSGPYMRKFLDGYYPMRLTLEIEYPTELLSLINVSPESQPGFRHDDAPGLLRMDAIFEGVLQTLAQFEKI
ncbi:MAG: hypothetical protein ACK4SR_11650 [Thiobacillus sp.]